MKIVSWNVKGLGNSRKNFSIKELLRKYKVDLILLQETKKHSTVKNCFRSLWRGKNKVGFILREKVRLGACLLLGELTHRIWDFLVLLNPYPYVQFSTCTL